jgi:maleate isomerase
LGYGLRLRIGLLVPSSNTTMEPDFHRMAPEGVSVHTARMRLDEVTPDGLIRMADDAERGAALLATAGVDVIVYGCTTGSLVGGVRWEEDLVDRLHNNTGIRTMSTSGAVVGALRALSARRVGVATPYTDVLNLLETEFLEDHGFQVAAVEGLGLVNNLEIGRVEGRVIEGLVEAVAGEADTIFVSCTNLPALDLIDGLERRHGRPVVTSNQASLWAVLRDSSVKAIIGYGELLRDRL